ncbi:MAG TPA: dihydroxyacetone kinase subunit DhaL [Acidimicrobiia bacterium]|nr:dihydroxyacetone kinase subunit DhaL [Acidimicrobiia bacterium]
MSEIAADVALDVGFFRRWMTELAAAVESECDELTRLDAAIGDADHGINMLRGMRAVLEAVEDLDGSATPGDLLHLVGNSLVTVVGGAAGPLYGTAFRSMGASLAPHPIPTLEQLATAVLAGLQGIQRMGAAEPGDKTIVDAWIPASRLLIDTSNGSVRAALVEAERAAHEGMLATIPLRARKGRASYLGWRSQGHQDPGATSARLIFASLVRAAT